MSKLINNRAKLVYCSLVFFASCVVHTPQNIDQKKTTPSVVKMAVTVDDLPAHGPFPVGVTKMEIAQKFIAILKKHNVPEVYGFVNAEKTDQDPKLNEILKLWVEAGHPLGNHTYTHKKLNDVSIDEYKTEIDKVDKTIEEFGKKYDWKVFRYTFLSEGKTLEKRNAIRQHLFSKGYKIAQVTVNSKDWAWNDAYVRCVNKGMQEKIDWLEKTFLENGIDEFERAQKISQALYHRQIPHILLLHIGAFDNESVDQLLTAYEKMGVQFITLTEAMKDTAYSVDPGVATKWGSTFLLQMMDFKKIDMSDVGIPIHNKFDVETLENICN